MADNRSCCTSDVVSGGIREAVCIDTNRVYDSCAEKEASLYNQSRAPERDAALVAL